ncbi:hypothetical protein FQR65_LT11535 [Abscondita terminalis]|nr:hypothetical protein FQR65_LT11535 [Abscondita terminalis]
MELRSSRSRSRTPFISSTYESEVNEDQTGRTLIRTTRSSTKIISSSFDDINSNNNLNSTPTKSMKTRSSKSEKTVRRTRYKTSDYSSEDGETLISASLENTNNHILEDSRDSANRSTGSVSAIDYYRAAGEYWNKYPKTDYTYSLHSRDKTEIAPGVIAMPNMSRRSLHGGDSCSDFILAHKQTNTEEDEFQYTPTYSYNSSNENVLKHRRTNLFANNNYNSKYKSTHLQDVYVKKTFRSRITNFLFTIVTWISSVFYYMYSTQSSIVIGFGKMVHKVATRVMLWDTWLLRSLKNKNKLTSLLAVCLIPLLLFGGWWLLTQLESVFTKNHAEHETVIHGDRVAQKIIKENVILEPTKADGNAHLQEIANLVRLQLDLENYYSSDVLIEKIISSPKVQHVINSYKLSNLDGSGASVTEDALRNQQDVIEALRLEIDKMRLELLQLEKLHNNDVRDLIAQLRSEHEQSMAKLTVKINRCCRTSLIQMESYITKMLKNLFQAPNNLGTYKDISQWIRSTFVAKEDLETRLSNATQNLQSNFDNLIRNNGEVIMGEVMSRVTAELNQRMERAQRFSETADVNIDPISDERIRKIVQQSLSLYDADKTGLVDYALESAGGEILTTRCTESYQARTAVMSIFGIRIWYPSNTARTVITPGVVPGECWAFQNFPAFLVIKLVSKIKIEAFSYEHMSKLLAPNGNIDSAPKEFYVYGLHNETDSNPLLLGRYFYDYDGPALQYFAANVHDLSFHIIELKIVSNHGNPNYTCLYRFRVHGKLDTDPS